MAFLKPFYDFTKRAEGLKLNSARGALSDYITTLNILIRHVKGARDDILLRCADPELNSENLELLKACIINCWNKLDVYFLKSNTIGVVYAAVVIQPKSKFAYFQNRWADQLTWIQKARIALSRVWEEYKTVEYQNTTEAGAVRQRSLSLFQDETNMTQFMSAPGDQLDDWIKEPPFQLGNNESLVDFWLRKRRVKNTANLAQLALDMAAIPAMSSECERVFSQGKLLITGQRHRLKVDIIEATQCLRCWLIADRKLLRERKN